MRALLTQAVPQPADHAGGGGGALEELAARQARIGIRLHIAATNGPGPKEPATEQLAGCIAFSKGAAFECSFRVWVAIYRDILTAAGFGELQREKRGTDGECAPIEGRRT